MMVCQSRRLRRPLRLRWSSNDARNGSMQADHLCMLYEFALHCGYQAEQEHEERGDRPLELKPCKSFWSETQRKRVPQPRVTQRASRSVGLAVAGAIGLLPGALLAQHPQPHATEAGLLSAVYRSNISGVVRDAQGQPQIGALVELLNPDFGLVARTFTDDHGRYSLQRLGAGLYQIKASDTPFLPTLRPDLRVLTNARVVVNLTLSTVYQALQWLPAERRSSQTRDDDWDWTLRLSANRPLLRFAGPTSPAGRSAAQGSRAEDEGSQSELVVVQNSNEGSAASHPYHAEIASGPRHFGQGGTSQQTSWRGGDGQTRALLLSEQSSVADAGRISASAGYQQQLSPDRSVAVRRRHALRQVPLRAREASSGFEAAAGDRAHQALRLIQWN